VYISNLSHFLDENGTIAQQMYKEGREMAGFLALCVDFATQPLPFTRSSGIRCVMKKCPGNVNIDMNFQAGLINWSCPVCKESGTISGWQGTRWHNK
jgi:hypothetical protein